MADFNIASSIDGDMLLLTFTGKSTEKNANAMTRRYFEVVLESGLKKVLVDIRALAGRLSESKTYFLVRDLPVKPAPAGIRTAVVESSKNRQYGEFLEATAANAGVYFRSFVDYAEALAWLHTSGAPTRV